ncbi:putative defense protein 3 [Tetranychus urticae]|uniref:Reelin domain-containing protein n=1 Tax=Tetranychus urticae TaxID=32264 RepID=T1L3T8_TETUR|nr:putative defense protein 3 [Tetranychus urticae]
MFTRLNNCLYLFVIVFISIHLPGSLSWPSGAPENACNTLSPGHGANRPKSPSSSPFVIIQSHSDYKTGDSVQVMVKAPEGLSFRGMMVQAYDPSTGQTIGKWQEGRGLKMINSCSAVSHSDRRGKRSATLVWDAPEDRQSGKVAFRGTIVQRYSEFYEGLESTLSQQ